MLNRISKPFLGFLQSSGLVTYLILVSTFFNYIPKKIDNSATTFLAPIIMLLFFIISAVISSLLVLGRAGVLFWEKKYKEAFTIVAWTIIWGIVYFSILLIILYNN